jgi:hypothetical protein
MMWNNENYDEYDANKNYDANIKGGNLNATSSLTDFTSIIILIFLIFLIFLIL